MKKIFTLFSFLLAALLMVNAKAFLTPEGEDGTEVEPTIELFLVEGEESEPINLTNGNASVEFATGIEVAFDGIVPQEATYTIQNMILVEGEESSSWTANETIAEGDLMLSGKGVAEFEEPIIFNQGERYVLTVVAKANGQVIATQSNEFNGATVAPIVSEALLLNGEEQIALNSHNAVSVEKMNAIKVTFGNAVDVKEATVAVAPMVLVEGEEGSSWVPGVPAVTALSINTIGYADLAYTFEQGTKYQIDINVTFMDGSEETVTYNVDGATAGEEVDATMTVSGDKNDVKILFSWDDVAPSWNVDITLNGEKVELEFDEDWDVTNVLHLNGKNLADGEYTLVFTVGSLMVNGDLNDEEYSVSFEIVNGEVVAAAMITSTSLMLGEEEVAINDHSSVSVESADAIKVQVENEPSVIGFSYAINAMKLNESEDGQFWTVDESYDLAVGEGNFNGGMGYAQFEDGAIFFEQGNKYQVKVTVYGGNPAEPAELAVYTYEINGAYADALTTTTSLMLGEEEVAINDHSAVSVESADAIKVQVENEPSVIGFSYAINAMKLNESEDGQFWTVDESYDLAVGEGNFNGGMGYVQFEDGAIFFEQGNKYQVKVTVYGGNPAEPAELAVYTYEINGAYAAALTTTTSLMLGEEEVAINDHSSVSVESADAIKVQVENEPSVIGFSYAINAMKLNESEDGQFWTVDESYDLAVGEGNFNGGMGYAQFEDGAIFFEQGNKYQVKVTVYGGNPAEPAELAVYTYEINGAYADALTTTTSLMLGEEEVAINDHSSVSVESADAIKVQVENEPSVIGFSYAINAMKLNESEDGQFWTVDESYDLAVGEGNFNGGMGYVQFEDGAIFFEQGNKYQVKVTVYGGNPAEPAELAVYTYEINGAYADALTTTTSLMLGEEEVAINDHSSVSVESADAIKVQVENEPSVIGFSYTINAMKLNESEDGQFWTVDESYDLAVGEGNFNGGMGYAQFEDGAIFFEQGNKYQVKVTVYGGNPAEPAELAVYTYEINGAAVAPAITDVVLLNGEEEIALNGHNAVSVEKMDAITVTFGNPAEVKEATVAISPLVLVEGEEGSTWVPGVPAVTALSISTIGYAELAYTFEQGTKYQIDINVTYMDGSEETFTYNVDGATDKGGDDGDAMVVVNSRTELDVVFPEGTDLGDNYTNAMYIVSGDEKIMIGGNYYTDNTTGDFFDPLNKLVITLEDELANGEYTLVIPEGSFIINQGDNNKEMRFKFTVDFATAINGINAANDTKVYNLSGVQVNKNTKGIVIMNGKKVVKK